MTDRELLALAAKAAGGELSEGHAKHRTGETWETWEWVGPLGITLPGKTTHPLENDGDAFRLLGYIGSMVDASCPGRILAAGPCGISLEVYYDDLASANKEEAMRRAIVLVAAEIGKGMK